MDFEERTEMRLKDHGERIRTLELTDAKDGERITSLYVKMDELLDIINNWMEFAQQLYWKVLGAAGGLIGILLMFFIWYIQCLPTK